MTARPASEQLTILIVEDDDGHATLVRGHLEDAGVANPTIRFRDGQEAWDFLARTGPEPHRETGAAYLMLLDIRMPRMDGVQLLKKLKSNAELKAMPVIMLTTTDDPLDVEECYRAGCSGYVVKSLDFERFTETLRQLGHFIQVLRVSPLP
jgi:CheY-like chemotaxis protein